MDDKLPDSLAPVASPPRRLLWWCLGIAALVSGLLLSLGPEEDAGNDTGRVQAVVDGVASGEQADASLKIDELDTSAPDDQLSADQPSEVQPSEVQPSDDQVTADVTVDAEPAVSAAALPEPADELSLAVLLGDRPAIVAMSPDAFVVTADGRRFEPGDELVQGIVLDAIEAESLHFSRDGESFSRAAFANAVAAPAVD